MALRPLAIVFEGMLPGKPSVLVLSLPVAMLVVTLSAIPVHIEYYKSKGLKASDQVDGEVYVSCLFLILASAVFLMWVIMSFPVFGFSGPFIFICCLYFISEKLFDEVSRSLEFDRKFGSWFYVQLFRSGWVFFPIIFAFFGFEYIYAFIGSMLLVLALTVCIFFFVTGLKLRWRKDGVKTIYDNSLYFFGSFIPASSRHLPRIIIVKVYPDFAHVFLAMAQLAQGLGIVFNVRYQIPYRKIIARKPRIFQRLFEPAMRAWLILPIFCLAIYALFMMFYSLSDLSAYQIAFFLFPIVFSDVVLFSILSVHLGYVQWMGDKLKAFVLYVLCMVFGFCFVLLLYSFDWLNLVNLSGVLVASMAVSLFWLVFIKVAFFIPSISRWL